MSQSINAIRTVGAFIAGVIAMLAGFGLMLALAWTVPAPPGETYKLVTTLFAASFAFMIGGAVSAAIAERHRVAIGFVVGLLMGFCAFGYVLGRHWGVLIATPLAALLGAIGGRLTTPGS